MAGLRPLQLKGGVELPEHLLSVTFSRSGGPGGQNVNSVATSVDLRVDLDGAVEILGQKAVARVRQKLQNRLDGEGRLQIVSREHRTQPDNLRAALSRAEGLLKGALTRRKRRIRTRPTRASRERRLRSKKQRGEVKRLRRAPRRPRD